MVSKGVALLCNVEPFLVGQIFSSLLRYLSLGLLVLPIVRWFWCVM